tara:strand:- start:347 stop:571 length:225 start_codon:yes stop_codon:yes gene_type:complete
MEKVIVFHIQIICIASFLLNNLLYGTYNTVKLNGIDFKSQHRSENAQEKKSLHVFYHLIAEISEQNFCLARILQ